MSKWSDLADTTNTYITIPILNDWSLICAVSRTILQNFDAELIRTEYSEPNLPLSTYLQSMQTHRLYDSVEVNR